MSWKKPGASEDAGGGQALDPWGVGEAYPASAPPASPPEVQPAPTAPGHPYPPPGPQDPPPPKQSSGAAKVLVPLVLLLVVAIAVAVLLASGAFEPGSDATSASAPSPPTAQPSAPPRTLTAPTVVGTIGVERGPGAVAVSPDRRSIYVLHRGHPAEVGAKGFEATSVLVIDASTRQTRGRIQLPAGSDPGVMAISPDGAKAYVTTAGRLSILDLRDNVVAGTIKWDARGPAGAVFSPDGSTAYVENDDSNSVSVVDPVTNMVTASIPAGSNPRDVAIAGDGSRIYVSSFADNAVWVVDTSTRSVVATIPLGMSPGGLCVSPDSRWVYVATGAPGGASGHLVAIDTASNTIAATVPIAAGSAKIPAVSPDGLAVYVTSFDRANGSAGSVTMVDTRTNSVTGVVAVGRAPKRLTVSPDGRFIYVPNQSSDDVTVLSTGAG